MQISKTHKIELVAGRDALYPELENVMLEIGNNCEARLIATNGHALAVVPVATNEHDTSGLVTTEALKAARTRKAELTCNGALNVQHGPTFARPVDGEGRKRFPEWERHIPVARPEVHVALDAALLKSLADALGAKAVVLSFAAGAEGQIMWSMPIRVRPNDPENAAYGMLMPCRIGPAIKSALEG